MECYLELRILSYAHWKSLGVQFDSSNSNLAQSGTKE